MTRERKIITVAGRGYARSIPRWQAAGYHVRMLLEWGESE